MAAELPKPKNIRRTGKHNYLPVNPHAFANKPKGIPPIYASLAPKPQQAYVPQQRTHLGSEILPTPGASLVLRNLSNKGRKLNQPLIVPHPISIPPAPSQGGTRRRGKKRQAKKRGTRRH